MRLAPLIGALSFAAVLGACERESGSSLQGYVEGEYVSLASPYAGQLQKLYVRRGDTVQAGKPVFALEQQSEAAARAEAEQRLRAAQARLENLAQGRRAPEVEALRAELRQAQSARELSQANLAREEMLIKTGASSRASHDQAKSAFERDRARVAEIEAQLRSSLQPLGRDAERKAAEADIAAARAALEQAAWRQEQKSVSAPAAGLVQDTYFVEGEWVPAGRPVASVLPPENVKVRFYVPEPLLASVSAGREVEVRCDGCPAAIPAKVVFVSAQAEYTPPVLYSKDSRTKLLYLAEARPQPGSKLHPGQPVDVRLR